MPHEEKEDSFRGCKGAGTEFTLPGAEPSYAPDLALEPTHIDIRMRFDVARRAAGGFVTTTVKSNREGARSLKLDAVGLDDVAIRSASPLQWRYDGERIHLSWDSPFERGEERDVEVRYRVIAPITGMRFSTPDEQYPDRAAFMITDHETERARYWLPCVDYPNVRTTYRFHLTAPEDYTILANGRLESEERHDDGTKTAHWELDFPCPSYLCCIAVGQFVRYDEDEAGGIPISYFAAAPFTPEHLRRSFGRTPPMLSWLQERLGAPFPFPKYFQIALPGVGGAMENISLVTWDETFLMDEANGAERGHVTDSVNIHEMAHSYFGDAIVCRHFEHSWLKESWATYIETVWLEEHLGREERDYDLVVNADRYIEESDTRYARPIVTREYDSSWSLFDAHLYPGGAWRIHMLRNLVGEEPFWEGVRAYVAEFMGGVVETDDFRRALEKSSGLNLTRFFDDWIHRPGYPKLDLAFRHDAEKSEGSFTLKQTQADKKKGIPNFDLALEIEWTDTEGATHRTKLATDSERTVTVVGMPAAPKLIRVDPGLKLLCSLEFNPGDDLLRTALTDSGDVAGRIRAARALIKTGRRANMGAVGAAMNAESFWGVRVAVAKALAASLSADAAGELAGMLLAEKDDKAKPAIAQACAGVRDTRVHDALLALLERNPGPFAAFHAADSLGAQRHMEDFEVLGRTGESDPGLHGLVRAGALSGVGRLRSPEGHEWLDARIEYGVEAESLRHHAVKAFGDSAVFQDRRRRLLAVERLADLTRDPADRVRMRAGAALGGLGETSAIGALEALKTAQAKQDAPAIERWIGRLRKGAEGEEVTALRRQFEELQDKHRTLDERLQNLEARSDADTSPSAPADS